VTVWTVPATVKRVVDGDTIKVDLDLGWRIMLLDQSVRVAHINAPELSTLEGVVARDYAVSLLPVGQPVTVVSHSLDKYGRVLGDIRFGDVDFGAAMVSTGHAVAVR
jgi:micrococcal nuclease